MADEISQATAEPTATAVETPPVEQASQEKTAASTEAKISVEQYREQLKSGELSKTIADSGMEPGDWITKYVQTEATSEPSTEEPPQQAQPTEPQLEQPVVEEKKEIEKVTSEPKSGSIKDLKSFIKALRSKGFNYDTVEKALDGYVNKEQAVNLYRKEARENRTLLKAEQAAREAEAQKIKSLQDELNSLKTEIAKKANTPPPPRVNIPEDPVFPEVDDEKAVDKYQKDKKAREDALLKEYQRMMNEQANRYERQLNELTNSVKSLTSEFEANKQREAVIKRQEEQDKKLENAFRSAEDLMDKVPRYKTSKPFNKVHEEYSELIKDIKHIQDTTPGFVGYDLLAEYMAGNQVVANEFARRQIDVTEDIRNYLTIAQLERDALNHNLTSNGRPDLVKALRLREEDEGIRQQEIHEAKMEGYDQASEIQRSHSAAPKQMPISSSSAAPDGPKPMTVDEVRAKLADIRKMTSKSKIDAAMKELQPHMKRLQEQETS